MESTMNDEVGGMVRDGYALVRRFLRANAFRQHDIAQQHLAIVGVAGRLQQVMLHHRE